MNFFIYPEKDTTLYKKRKLRFLNSGIDEVIELTNLFSEAEGHDVSRILIKFNIDGLKSQITELRDVKFILNFKIMQSSELLENDLISAYPLKKEWAEGTGRFIPSSDAKKYTLGANWKYTDGEEELWKPSSHYDSIGGGDWFESEVCLDEYSEPSKINCNFQFSKNFSDVKIDVTKIVNFWISEEIPNHGFVVKFESEENNGGNVKFYSSDTNTIYSPYIQIKYNDFVFDPCKKIRVKKLICTEHTTPTPTPFNSGSLCSGSLESGSLCSGSIESGTIYSGTVDSGSIIEDSLEDGVIESNEDLFNESNVSYQKLDEMANIVFTSCDKSMSNQESDAEENFQFTSVEKTIGNLKQVEGPDLVPHIKRIKKEYRGFSKERLSVGIREKYPNKTFSKKSDYALNNFVLDSIKYSVRDAETDEVVIEFDEYSRISCDSTGHFFNFDFGCLAPGRVYKFLLLIESDYGDFLHEDKRRFIVRI